MILCPGAAHTGIAGRYLARSGGVRRVRLQMMQTAPLDARVTTALADGDSLRYYPAFDLPGRDQLPPQEGAAAQTRAQLLLVQRADGGLTIGDTHEYAEPFAFDLDEDAYDHLRGRAEALLGTPLPRIQRRWAGVYSEVDAGRGRPRAVSPGRGRARRGPGHRPGRARHDLFAGDRGGDVLLMTRITVACLDMAGTTVADDGTVMEAFTAAIAEQNLPVAVFSQAMKDVRSSMGQSKIEVFRRILGRRRRRGEGQRGVRGPLRRRRRPRRGRRHARRRGHLRRAARRRDPGLPGHRLLPGHQGRHHRQARLGWPDRPGPFPRRRRVGWRRGRPWPDLPLTALLRLGGGAVSELAVAGDTGSDVESGLRAGAAVVAGVLTGASTRADLEQAGAPLILDTIAGLLPHVVS